MTGGKEHTKTDFILLILIMWVAAFFLTGCSLDADSISPDQCIAHRGAMDRAPQDTLAAVREAKEIGYSAFECDVWYTLSDELFVCHGPSLEKETGQDLYAWELDSENREDYPIIHGEGIEDCPKEVFSTLEEILDCAATYKMKPYIHLKSSDNHRFPKEGLRLLNRILKRYRELEPVVFTSDKGLLEEMERYEVWEKGFLCSTDSRREAGEIRLFANSKQCRYLILLYSEGYKPDKEFVEEIHDNGMKAICYGVKEKKDAQRMFRNGVDYCIVDAPLFQQ